MLTQRAPVLARFTRSDAMRLGIAATSLIVAMTAILAFDIPADPVRYELGEVVREDVTAPKVVSFESQTLTEEARSEARAAIRVQRGGPARLQGVRDLLDAGSAQGAARDGDRRT